MAGREGRKRKPVPRTSSFRTVAVLMLVPLLAFAGYYGYQFLRTQRPQIPSARRTAPQPQQAAVVAPKHKPTTASVPAPSRRHSSSFRPGDGAIVLILDDVGFDRQPLAAAMTIDPNINFSILPNASNAASFAETLHARGFEVMCHLPMEPVDYPQQSPGRNAIMTSMPDEEIARVTEENIAGVPHAVGVNNHMGSRATRDERVMNAVLAAMPKGMFFIDSVTTSSSVAGRLASEMSIPTASRSVFLDDEQNEAAVRHQLAALTAAAQQKGVAVGIGHMYPVTIKVLAQAAPELRRQGLRFVRASSAVN